MDIFVQLIEPTPVDFVQKEFYLHLGGEKFDNTFGHFTPLIVGRFTLQPSVTRGRRRYASRVLVPTAMSNVFLF